MITLKEKLAESRGLGTGFHFMRHALATLILVHHTYVLTFGGQGNVGYVKGEIANQLAHLSSKQIFIEMMRPGLFSLVGAFFALSGFLVVGSAIRTKHAGRFLWFRIIRITPALCVEVTLSAIILGGLFTKLNLRDYYLDPGFAAYFLNIFGIVHYFLPGVFLNNPMPEIVNVNLWTLPAEFHCYAVMLALMLFAIVFKERRYNLVFVVMTILTLVGVLWAPTVFSTRFETTHYTAWFVVYLFLVGIFFYINADRVVLHPVLFAISAFGYWILTIFSLSDVVAVFFLVYCVVYLGTLKYEWFDRLVKGDYSYGIYLYGYPIAQAIIAVSLPYVAGIHGVQRFLFIAPPALLSTFCFAYVSWHGIEKRALKFKNLGLPRKIGMTSPVVREVVPS